jgi:hypothetical protein
MSIGAFTTLEQFVAQVQELVFGLAVDETQQREDSRSVANDSNNALWY